MEWFEAVLLGLVQGLTEFLPVSSSGHLEIGKALLGVETTDDLLFTTMVHAATVLSTIVVFRKEILDLLEKYQVRRCFYGHLHSGSHKLAVEGIWDGVDFRLVASDYLDFKPYRVI